MDTANSTTQPPLSTCCNAGIRYINISKPMYLDGPVNTLIFWCSKCGNMISGKTGAVQPQVKITD